MKKIKIESKKNGVKKPKGSFQKYIRLFKKEKSLNKKKRVIFFLSIFIIALVFIIIIYKIFIIKSLKKSDSRNYQFTSHAFNENNQKLYSYNISSDFNDVESILNNYKRDNIDWPIIDKIQFKPWMSERDMQVFCYFMNPKNIYFEFGSGGTTNIAFYYNMTIYSVESDKNWHDKLKNSGIKANYITIDLKSNDRGYPGKETTVEDWKKYIQAYKPEYNAKIIYIDGRFRVACALDIFGKIPNDTFIVIHDYDRIEYHVVEDYYLKLESWDKLAVFIKRSNITSIPEDIYNKYLYIQI